MYNFDFNITGGNSGSSITINKSINNGVFYADVHFESKSEVIPELFSVTWKISGIGCNSVWHPFERIHTLRPDWGKNTCYSRLASGLPIYQIISADDKNTICFSVSDADTPIKLKSGYIEETAELECEVEFFCLPTNPVNEYNATIRIDMRDLPFYDSIYGVVDWWENNCGYKSAFVPKSARLPVDSLWYSFHQNLDFNSIIEECRCSYDLGMRTVIIDDGWQTDDNNRGYAFCGDWLPSENKMGDMELLVENIHNIGMKVMLWFSVPFIGVYSEKYNEFKDMLLDNSGNNKDYFAFDPRYKKVRDYLCSVYVNAVKKWDLDGLKLDFIDSFVLGGKSLEYDCNRDVESLEDSIHALLRDVKAELVKIKPDIMIEFRQSYIGPSIRKYGNMLRVGDCPADYLTNRTQIIDLRLTSGDTAVHSDMVMWNTNERTEVAALQLANIIFAVPQISVKLSELSDNHKELIKYYIEFYNKYLNVLSYGYLTAKKPDVGYSQATINMDDISITALYSDPVVEITEKKTIIVNATDFVNVIVKNAKGKRYKQVDCLGAVLNNGIIGDNVFLADITMGGMIFID